MVGFQTLQPFTVVENFISQNSVKDRLERLLNEVKTMNISNRHTQPYQTTNDSKLTKPKIIDVDEKILRLQMCIDSIEALNKQWIECAQKSKTKKEDEENYAQIATGE